MEHDARSSIAGAPQTRALAAARPRALLRSPRWRGGGARRSSLRAGPLIIVILGGWELAARLGLIDPFFFSMPSRSRRRSGTGSPRAPSQGPLWVQVLRHPRGDRARLPDRRRARRDLRRGARPQPTPRRHLQHLHQDREFRAAGRARLDLHHRARASACRPRWRSPWSWCSSWCSPTPSRACAKPIAT